VRQNVYLDGDPGGPWMGHALAEVGCIWQGPVHSEVITRAPGEIARFLRWLKAHGEPGIEAVEAAAVKAQVVEIREVAGFGQSGSAVGIFGPDREPATDRDIDTAVRRLGYARRDLHEAMAGLPPDALDWQPPARLSIHDAARPALRPAAPKRTIRKNLEHICRAQVFYLSRVLGVDAAQGALPEPWPKDTFACLEWVVGRSVEALQALTRQQRSGLFQAADPAEDWTARKMLRRFVEHEREHAEVVRRAVELRNAPTSGMHPAGRSPAPSK